MSKRQNKKWLWLSAFILALALVLPPGKVPLALALIGGLLLIAGVLALAYVGFLFCVVVVVTYRSQQRGARASAWPKEIAAPDEPAPEPVEHVRGRNGHYE